MKRVIIICLLLFITAAISACHNPKRKTTETESKAKDKPKKIVMMGIDDTGSYHLLDQAKHIASHFIMQLEPGDVFYLRRITDKSYSDSCNFFRLELPQTEVSAIKNPFDRKARKQRKALEHHTQALKREAIKKIKEMKPIGARKTDIFGFLAVASEKFSHKGQNIKPIVIIASDLQDNVRFKPDLILSDVTVAVVGFQVMNDPKETAKCRDKWKNVFNKAGASKTIFIRSDEKVNIKSF